MRGMKASRDSGEVRRVATSLPPEPPCFVGRNSIAFVALVNETGEEKEGLVPPE
jgi:hypothetical protein